MRCRLPFLLCLAASLCFSRPVRGDENVRAELLKKEVWMGEPAPMILTLYSPGPFSGTASFDLPDLPKTVITKIGSPLVGSEEVDGESMLTQRHEFRVFTQRSGTVTIPAFKIRYEAKKDFTSKPEPKEVTTKALTFESKRPPNASADAVIVAARSMDIVQQWSPDKISAVNAGAVIERTIKQTAENTTAMLLPPPAAESMEGVRLYRGEPIVRDNTQRGEATAMRSETLKYQFQQPGTVSLPPLRFQWWDTSAEEIKTITLPGKTIDVTAPPSGDDQEPDEAPSRLVPVLITTILALVGVCLAAYRARFSLQSAMANLRQRFYDPERAAAQRLSSACRANDAHQAYAAALTWRRLVGGSSTRDLSIDDPRMAEPRDDALGVEIQRLAQHLFGRQTPTEPWSGAELLRVVRERRRRPHALTKPPAALPPLNPTD